MVVLSDALTVLALVTATTLYTLAWYVVRQRPLSVRWIARTALFAVVFAPALYVAWFLGSDGKRRYAANQASAPTKDTSQPQPQATGISDPTVAGSKPPTAQPVSAKTLVEASKAPARPNWDQVHVFYGTDRARRSTDTRLSYGSSRGGKLELGRAEVSVPRNHQVPKIERPWHITVPWTDIALYEQAEDPAKHFTVRALKHLSRDEFVEVVRARLARSQAFKDHAVVFIHGYNTTFDYALFRTAQMAYDLNFDGVPFLYSWPSVANVAGYVYDRDSAEQAEPYLRDFLQMIVNDTGAKSVSMIAHSMGNLPMLRVLRDIEQHLPDGVKLNQVILAAPDVDRNLFDQLARNIKSVGQGITLYASRNDRAMSTARVVAGGVPRAGDVPADGPVIIPGIDTIDISSASTDVLMLNHSLYAERGTLLGDIGALLQTGLRPPDRRVPSLQRITTPQGDYWRLP